MDTNTLKSEINVDWNKNENQNNNEATVVTKKLKNMGILTINHIYTNAKTKEEKLKLLESEYLKLQDNYYEVKREFINYKANQNWSEIPLKLIYLTEISKELEENKINYKIIATDNGILIKLLVKTEHQGKVLEILNSFFH